MVKAQLLDKCRYILNDRMLLYPLNRTDTEFLMSIFPLHPRYYTKVSGKTIKNIIIRRHPIYHNRCFALVFTDGSTVDISYTECLGNWSYLRDRIVSACLLVDPLIGRETIKAWIKTFPDSVYSIALYLQKDSDDRFHLPENLKKSLLDFVIKDLPVE